MPHVYERQQILDLGGKPWTPTPGMDRIYLNHWHEIVGLEVPRDKEGTTRSALFKEGEIDNRRLLHMLMYRVYWDADDGQLHASWGGYGVSTQWQREVLDLVIAAVNERLGVQEDM